MPDKPPITEERLDAIETTLAAVATRLAILEAKLSPRKSAPLEIAPPIVRQGAAKGCHFNTSPEVAADLAKRYPRAKDKKEKE